MAKVLWQQLEFDFSASSKQVTAQEALDALNAVAYPNRKTQVPPITGHGSTNTRIRTWTSLPLPSQSALPNPAATPSPTSPTTAVPPAMVFASSRKKLLEALVSRAVLKSCSLRRHQSRLPHDFCVDMQDDMGQLQQLSVRTTPVVRFGPMVGMSTAHWDVTVSCKFPCPGMPAASLDLVAIGTYLPLSDSVSLDHINWIGDTDANGDLVETACVHEWQEYNGLREKYNYCTKCDVKDKPNGR